MRHLRRVSVAAATAGVALLALVTPADAERVQFTDPIRDNWSPEGAHDWTREGSVPNTDLVSTGVAHTHQAVVIRASYRNLKKRVSDEINFTAYLRTGEAPQFQVSAQVDYLGRDTFVAITRSAQLVRCDNAVGHADFHANKLRVTVPRHCLGNPDFIRYRALAESYREATGLFRDSAMARGPKLSTWSSRIERG